MSNIFAETGLITILRAGLFLSCRKYLLRSLYHDLQDLSSVPNGKQRVETPEEGPEVELELLTLPLPSTQRQSDAPSRGRRPHALHSWLAGTTFSVCFSESCTMFLILMAQGLNIFSARTRILNWRISLWLLLATILVFIPLSLSLILTIGPPNTQERKHQRSLVTRILFYTSPVALYLFLLSYIPLPAALSSSDMMTTTLSRLIVLGTVILGLLSGFGAIRNAWAFFPRSRFQPSEEDVRVAEQALLRVRNDLADRQTEVQRREASQPKAEGTWLSRVVPSFRRDESAQEIQGLEALEYEMSRRLDALKHARDDAKFARSFRGKVFNLGGRMFAIYCIFRVISSIINIVKLTRTSSPGEATTTYPDLITHFLAYLLALVGPEDIHMDDVAVFSRQLSLVLVGLIILSSVRMVLRGVTRALRVTSRNLGASLMLLILAQLMGIYLLSTVVQLRTTFPPLPPDASTSPDAPSVQQNLFSTIPAYEVFGALFDWSFLCAAAGTAAARWAGERMNGTSTLVDG